MLFRDELEESGMDKEEMDAAVAEHRAQLLAEAEKELAAEKQQAARAAQEASRADRKGRCAPAAGTPQENVLCTASQGAEWFTPQELILLHSVTARMHGEIMCVCMQGKRQWEGERQRQRC